MSGNPGFISDDGKNNSFTPAFNLGKDPSALGDPDSKNYVVELKDLKEKEANANYEPYAHREVEHPTTNLETLFHLLKGSIGTGILSMPLAFKYSGYAVGTVCTIVIGIICTYCVHLVIKSEYELCKRKKVPSMSFNAITENAMLEGPPFLQKCAPYSVHVVNMFLIFYTLGACCVYTVFIAENIQAVATEHMDHEIDVKIWMVITLLPLILINFIRNLKLLAPFSTAANAITIVSFGCILYYMIDAGITFENHENPREPVGDISKFPLYFGTVLFALEAIGVIVPLENEMKTPAAFKGPLGVLNQGMIFIVALYTAMGLLGYLAYGSHKVADTITLNLTSTDVLAQVVKIAQAIAIFITYPLQMYVSVDIVWNEYIGPKFEKSNYRLFYELVVRTILVLITFGLAVAIPRLDLFISLFGALCLSALGLSIPALIEMSTFWNYRTGFNKTVLITKNCALIIFGLVGLVIGTYTSLLGIIDYFNGN